MRKMICDRCGKEIARGEEYTNITITRHTNPIILKEQKTGCIGVAITSTLQKQEQDIQYAQTKEKDFCMNCTEKIIACINKN